MSRFTLVLAVALLTSVVTERAQAQDTNAPVPTESVAVATAAPSVPAAPADTARPTSAAKGKVSFLTMAPKIEVQNYRPEDKRGINVFEAPKDESVEYTGFKLQWGAAFTQQFQALGHKNTAAPRPVTTNGVTTDANQLINLGHGPNNAN